MLLARRNSNWLPDVFNDFFDTDFLPKVNSNTTAPAINVIEKKDEYDVELAAPGMTKEDFKVSLDEDCNLVGVSGDVNALGLLELIGSHALEHWSSRGLVANCLNHVI